MTDLGIAAMIAQWLCRTTGAGEFCSRLTQQHRPGDLVGLLEFFHLAEENGSGVFSRLNSAVGLNVS